MIQEGGLYSQAGPRASVILKGSQNDFVLLFRPWGWLSVKENLLRGTSKHGFVRKGMD